MKAPVKTSAGQAVWRLALMGRAESEDCLYACVSLRHKANPLPFHKQLKPLAVSCKWLTVSEVILGYFGDTKSKNGTTIVCNAVFCGERGIRTPGTRNYVRQFSKLLVSATHPSLLERRWKQDKSSAFTPYFQIKIVVSNENYHLLTSPGLPMLSRIEVSAWILRSL